ncbi:MAG: hypothetical protein IJ730_02945, partial [Alphaproteobacteria bacterium]|nr:hypothetical protein [Alphaproteobacteria bacterium]
IIENNYKTSKKKSKKQILDYPGIECENYYPKSIENIRSFYWKNTDRSRNISQKSTTIRICNWMFSQHKKMKKYSQKTTSDQKTVSEETPGINQKSLEE